MNNETFEIMVTPGFHRCAPEPSRDYGIGDPRLLFVLKHGGEAIVWTVFTNWGLPDEAFRAAMPDCAHPMHQAGWPHRLDGAMGGAVDWHLTSQSYESQEKQDCQFTDTGWCYGDAGFSIGGDLFDLLRTEGSDAVWTRLRELLDAARPPSASEKK